MAIDLSSLAMAILIGLCSVSAILLGKLYSLWSERWRMHDEAIADLPKTYATKKDMTELGARLEERLEDIRDAVKEGNATQRQLLGALLNTERASNSGILSNGFADK